MGAGGIGRRPSTAAPNAACCATWWSAKAGGRGQIQTRLVTSQARFPQPPVDLHTIVADDSGGTDGPTGVLREEHLREELCGLELEMSHGAFFQTNTEMAERLYAVAAEFAGLSGRERVFDLFCGIGTIGLTMAAEAGEVWGLEIVPEAIEDAERNAERNGIENAHFLAGNARTGVRPLLEKAGKPDVVVDRPAPRRASRRRSSAGCSSARRSGSSTSPATRPRSRPNAAQLIEAGYTLRRVRPVDMFPQTPHIECVALFEKSGRRRGAAHEPRLRRRGGARPRGGAAAGGALRRARLRLDVVQRPPRRRRPGDAGRVRRRGARRSTSASA